MYSVTQLKNEFSRAFRHIVFDYISPAGLMQHGAKKFWAAYVFPILVAIIINFAFLNTENAHSESEYVIFFTTIYAFWVGLFSSCQLVNNEVSSGEWSYWVLGHRRSFAAHFFAILSMAGIVALLQVAVFTTAFILADWLNKKTAIRTAFIKDDIFIDLYGNLSIPILVAGMIISVISGLGIGVLLSSIFKEPKNSIKATVGLMMIILVSSHTVLCMGKDSSDDPRFSPIYLIFKTKNPRSFFDTYTAYKEQKHKEQEFPCRDKSPQINDSNKKTNEEKNINYKKFFLSDIAYLFPQRYFFNIASIFASDRILMTEECKTNWRCVCCLNAIPIPNVGELKNFRNALCGVNDPLNKEKLEKLVQISKDLKWLIIKIIIGEASILVLQFVLCILMSLLIIYKGEKYYEIR